MPRLRALLFILFASSGAAALVYEIVWLEMLQLAIGSTAVSLAVLLSTFMGGLCLGSLLLPRFVRASVHPLRVFAVIELGIGLCGITVLQLIPMMDALYAAVPLEGLAGILWRGVVCALCLLAPTMLMGASLPAISRLTQAAGQLGYLYAANTCGAMAGSLVAGFYLLRVYDVTVASYTAAAINLLIAAVSWMMAGRVTHRVEMAAAESAGRNDWAVYTAIALSGLCSLGAEVVWTRQLSLLLGGTVYTFSLILAGFLAGIGVGGAAGGFIASRTQEPRRALGICQVLLAGAIAWSAYVLAVIMPYWQIKPLNLFAGDFVRCAAAIVPAALLWGASFPLALAAASRGLNATLATSRVYAVNTVGAIAGALLASLWLIPSIGTQQSQRVLIGLSVVAALAVLLPKRIALITIAAAGLAWFVPALPWGVIAYGRQLNTKEDIGTLIFAGEGMNSSIAITELTDQRLFHVSGKVEASSGQQDMRLQRMLGHLPALLNAQPRSALIVGCGAGVTAGSFVVHPSIEKITLCELEPLVPKTAARYFGNKNYHVISDKRTRVVSDDARHYILTTHDKFDVITSDPIHPWVKGSATLYTKEYFELCKQRLNPGGFITQWVPLYESNREAVMSEIATFFEVFPNGTIWGNDTDMEEGYDVVLLGQNGPAQIDIDALQARLEKREYWPVTQSLSEVGLGTAVQLLSTYAGDAAGLHEWLAVAQINRDRNLRLQYLAGLSPSAQTAPQIYSEMLKFRKLPGYITGGKVETLRKALRGQF